MASQRTIRPLVKEVYLGTLTGVAISIWQFTKLVAKLAKTAAVAVFRPCYISDAAVTEGRYLSAQQSSRITFEVFILGHLLIVFLLKSGALKPLDNELMATVSGEVTGMLIGTVYQAFYALSYLLGLTVLLCLQRVWLKCSRSSHLKNFVEQHSIYSYNALFLFGSLYVFLVRLGSSQITAAEQENAAMGVLLLTGALSLIHSVALAYKLARRTALKKSKPLLIIAMVATLTAVTVTTIMMMISITQTV